MICNSSFVDLKTVIVSFFDTYTWNFHPEFRVFDEFRSLKTLFIFFIRFSIRVISLPFYRIASLFRLILRIDQFAKSKRKSREISFNFSLITVFPERNVFSKSYSFLLGRDF